MRTITGAAPTATARRAPRAGTSTAVTPDTRRNPRAVPPSPHVPDGGRVMGVFRMHEADDDATLIAAYLRDGDERAITTLFERHLRSVHGFLFRFTGSAQDADDLTQETFIKAWRHLASVDPSRSFRTWLFSVARRTAIDLLRKRKTTPFAAFEDDAGGNALLDGLEDDADLPDELAAQGEAADMLRAALARLSPAFR